jgi:DNA-binding NtrC family response regulator
MPRLSRTLMYLGELRSSTFRNSCKARGWKIRPVSLLDAPFDLRGLEEDACGIVDLSTINQSLDVTTLTKILSRKTFGWLALVGVGDVQSPTVRHLVRDFCFDYVTIPVSDERILDAVGHGYGMAALQPANSTRRRAMPLHAEDDMLGTCEAMQTLFRVIRKVAVVEAPVFISGETGTGKELAAAAIHRRSVRRDKPFVAINCGAIPPHLLQSELFGYERGAFTGADGRKIGRIEAAHGGTLFLDEIGDLPFESQASLLRFLQERTVERLGSHKQIAVDVRVIAATHIDMQRAMNESRFRSDLYHRLCVLQIEQPPLRTRESDIELLAKHVLRRYRWEAARQLRGFSPCAVAAMRRYDWPGNVRELTNRVRRAIVMSERRHITAADLQLGNYVQLVAPTLTQVRATAERNAIERALLRHCGRLRQAAEDLQISRVTLYRLMRAHQMRPSTNTDVDD